MRGFTEQDGILRADGVGLDELAAAYGTPLYVYSAGAFAHNIDALQTALGEALPESRRPLICFACKANSNVAVLRLLSRSNLGADIVSGGELERALAAGIDPRKIVFSGVGKADAEIAQALDAGILQINVESAAELERIAAIAAAGGTKARVALRFNPDVDAGTHAKITTGKSENKFGLSRAPLIELYRKAARDPHLVPSGITLHIGSQLTQLQPFRDAFLKMAALVKDLRAEGLPVSVTDLGGGIGIVYDRETPPDLGEYARLIRDIVLPLETQVILEPGRLIAGNAGVLLTKLLYVKQGDNGQYAVFDAGMNDLMRPALYDAYHDMQPVKRNAARRQATYDLVGPVCETGDTFARGRVMQEMQPGDLAVFKNAGAYGFTMASSYNTRPLPAEVLTADGRHSLIRRRQTVSEMIASEIIPSWL